ncbi:MAG: ATP-grasp domain-containing protein [Lewinella sp.]|jgi:glutathione synthase|uniref:ATP-grasp domain-containing protein n=1 Tax=Lewinella sp. TaxID=2004506 RepID=UPI003D6B20B8
MIKAQYKVLVLTDHRGHSAENSIYALLRQMRTHPRCAGIDIASRSWAGNDPFFNGQTGQELEAATVTDSFSYTINGDHLVKNLKTVSPQDYDLVFLRLPRPISDEFLTWLADLLGGKAIVNHPRGILETSTKQFLLNFPEVSPSMRLCHSTADVLNFAAKFPIVMKPLKEYGGRGLLKIDGDKLDDGTTIHDTATYLKEIEDILQTDGMLAMKFLKNVSQGDKRIIVVGGQIMAASLRLPAPDSWLCNVAQGGTSVPTEVTPDEEAIIATINPKLQQAGILIYGADTLVDDEGKRVLSEVNTLSIGGFPQAEQQTGRPVIQPTIDKIFQYADAHYAG